MTVIGTARRTGAALAATAAVIGACVACSSSSNGTGNPAPGSVTSAPAVSTPTFGITATASVPIASASVSASPPAGTGNFCKDFNPRSVKNMGNAADINSLVKTFDKVAADAPPAIKPQADEVAKFLHDAASGNVDTSKTSKIEKDVEDITRYYIANCR